MHPTSKCTFAKHAPKDARREPHGDLEQDESEVDPTAFVHTTQQAIYKLRHETADPLRVKGPCSENLQLVLEQNL